MNIILEKLIGEGIVTIFRKVISKQPKQKENYPEVQIATKEDPLRPLESLYVDHLNVRWNVEYRVATAWTDKPDIVRILLICSKCKRETELKEKIRRTILGKYVWRCISCGFKKESPKNFELIKDEVKEKAKDELIKIMNTEK